MLITELIAQLETIKEQHGDCKIYFDADGVHWQADEVVFEKFKHLEYTNPGFIEEERTGIVIR